MVVAAVWPSELVAVTTTVTANVVGGVTTPSVVEYCPAPPLVEEAGLYDKVAPPSLPDHETVAPLSNDASGLRATAVRVGQVAGRAAHPAALKETFWGVTVSWGKTL